jgi:hypothetical protein
MPEIESLNVAAFWDSGVIMQTMKGGSKWLLEFLSNEYAKIPARKRSFLVWFENFEALFPSNLAISQANMLRNKCLPSYSKSNVSAMISVIYHHTFR